MAKLVDANLLIRYFTQDNPQQALSVKKLLRDFNQDLILSDLTVAEVVWVLELTYKLSRDNISELIISLLSVPSLRANNHLLTRALFFYRELNTSYFDAYLAAVCEEENLDGIYSFDKGLDKIPGIKRFEP